MKKLLLLLIFTFSFIVFSLFHTSDVNAQGVGINPSGNTPNPSALLDVDASGMNPKKGFLMPRMTTTERDAITSPAEGLQIFNTTTKCFESYINAGWYTVSCPVLCTPPVAPTAGTNTPSQTQVVWNWNAVSTASGYQWNTTGTYPGSGVNVIATPSFTQTGLVCNTAYTLYVWAYNVCGKSTATTLTQTTSVCGPSCGTQIWASANLNAGTQVNGGVTQSAGQEWCYNNLPANCSTYGGLFQWAALMGGSPYSNSGTTTTITCDPCSPTSSPPGVQGMCPSGYHIPSDLEWSRYEYCIENNIVPSGSTSLVTFQSSLGARGSAVTGVGPGDKIKESGTSHWASGNTGTNTSGFTALPAGYYAGGSFALLGSDNHFWTATEGGTTFAYDRILGTSAAQISRGLPGKVDGYSVRCLHD